MAQAAVHSDVSPTSPLRSSLQPHPSSLASQSASNTQSQPEDATHSPSSSFTSATRSLSSAPSRPTSSCGNSDGLSEQQGSVASSDHVIQPHKIDLASHPDLKQAPGAEFSIATKPQDQDPHSLSALYQEGSRDQDQEQQPPAYKLDQNGRVPANDYNYLQRDRLVADAQSSAIRSGHEHWVRLMQLSYLASQHHLSPYSVMKFGPRGSPFAYIPITLQQPHLVEETMQRQRQQETHAIQWLLRRRDMSTMRIQKVNDVQNEDDIPELPVLSLSSDDMATSNEPSSLLGNKRPASVITPPDARVKSLFRQSSDQDQVQQVERELSKAMSLPAGKIDARAPLSRTSSTDEESGPPSTNADDVDPSQFDRSTQIIEVKHNHQADDDIAAFSKGDSKQNDRTQDTHSSASLSTSAHSGSSIEVGGPLGVSNIMAQECEESHSAEQPAHPNGVSVNDAAHVGALPQREQNHLAMKTSDTHPIHISPILPDYLVDELSRRTSAIAVERLPIQNQNPRDEDQRERQSLEVRSKHSYMDMESHSQAQVQGRRLIRLQNPLNLMSITSVDSSASYMSQSQLAEQAAHESAMSISTTANGSKSMTRPQALIGNLLLSSCPGKKVRLSGPVRGRGAICRDLGLDLKRIYAIGVRAVVCCLDDDELSYLGAPWSEYEKEANALSLEVVRLPMAEGFAPTDVREMDTVVTSLVLDYTMKGVDVLVHCRGGVGRAGLIACAWMLKMGFVGTPSKLNARDNPAIIHGPSESYSTVGQETARGHQLGSDLENIMSKDAESDQIIDTVRSLIETIRRRRSPKAIETAEQVRFLVELVTFLQRQEQLRVSYPQL